MGDINQILDLRKDLNKLKTRHSVIALKTGTEIEDMDFDEIQWLKELSKPVLPITVKIGGPEARNDIRHCLKNKIDMILAPMVESVYALQNFVTTVDDLRKDYKDYGFKLAVNIESFEAAERFDAMLASTSIAKLSQITIGRTDLSKSMHLPVDDSEVISTAVKVIKKANNRGLTTSVGGRITMDNISMIVQGVPSNRINTRHIVFNNDEQFKKDPKTHLYCGLMFEQKLYAAMGKLFSSKKDHYAKREKELIDRLGPIQILKSL